MVGPRGVDGCGVVLGAVVSGAVVSGGVVRQSLDAGDQAVGVVVRAGVGGPVRGRDEAGEVEGPVGGHCWWRRVVLECSHCDVCCGCKVAVEVHDSMEKKTGGKVGGDGKGWRSRFYDSPSCGLDCTRSSGPNGRLRVKGASRFEFQRNGKFWDKEVKKRNRCSARSG